MPDITRNARTEPLVAGYVIGRLVDMYADRPGKGLELLDDVVYSTEVGALVALDEPDWTVFEVRPVTAATGAPEATNVQ